MADRVRSHGEPRCLHLAQVIPFHRRDALIAAPSIVREAAIGTNHSRRHKERRRDAMSQKNWRGVQIIIEVTVVERYTDERHVRSRYCPACDCLFDGKYPTKSAQQCHL